MTETSKQPEFDDELLSAYLDDELTHEERARVDARLAADPAARQMLDQLRAASLAIRNLPTEAVGFDLRDSIRSRAEQAMPTAAATAGGATNGAVWQVPNTCSTPGCLSIFNLLGRLPANALATGTTAIPLLDNEHRLYVGGRRNQVDLRVAKIFRFGPTRADVGLDLGNLLNTNYTTTYENTYQYSVNNTAMGGTWNNPTAIYTARFVRWNLTVDF